MSRATVASLWDVHTILLTPHRRARTSPVPIPTAVRACAHGASFWSMGAGAPPPDAPLSAEPRTHVNHRMRLRVPPSLALRPSTSSTPSYRTLCSVSFSLTPERATFTHTHTAIPAGFTAPDNDAAPTCFPPSLTAQSLPTGSAPLVGGRHRRGRLLLSQQVLKVGREPIEARVEAVARLGAARLDVAALRDVRRVQPHLL